jgi:lysophospholipase L1-like esterase
MAPTNIFVPGVPSIGKNRRRIYLSTAATAPPTPVADLTNYQGGAWTLFLNPYNKATLDGGLTGSDSALVQAAQFPNNTTISWTWPTRTPGIPIGYNQICYGDYFNTVAAAPITPSQINAINALTTAINFSHSTSPSNSHVVILDWFLTDAPNAHGAGHHKAEIEMALTAPSYFQGYVSAIGGGIAGAQLGTVTLSGIQFTAARDDTANSGAYPDFVFMPTDLADHTGVVIDINAVHQWLISKGQINGGWYYNGHAFGVEPTSGTGSITVSSMSAFYQPASTAVATMFVTTTGASTWTVPADFVSLVSVEGIAAGGDGASSGIGGSGGGAYSKITSTTTPLLPGTAISVGVGAAGLGTDGGNTWFNATSLADAVSKGSTVALGAEGGKLATTATGGLGGQAANGVGTTKFNGGSGGTAAGTVGSGGGGAGGPNGAGGAGSGGTTTAAGGGGGNGGGTAGSLPSGNTGGAGGDNSSGVGHGNGGPSGNPGIAGFSGGGGGGAGNGTTAGGTGGSGIEWDFAHGSGGGGGAEIGSGSTGGHGGLFGGGGGARRSGKAGQGILVIKYNAAVVSSITRNIIAANRGQFPTGITAFTSTQTCRKQYNSHPQGAISNLVCVDTNLYLASIAALSTSGYSMKRYVEYPAGTYTQVTWAGSGTVTLDSFSANSSALKSDPINLTIPANTKFWVRTVWTGGSMVNINLPAVVGLDDGTVAGDFGNSTATFSGTTTTYGPCTIMGDVATGSARAFALLGDSITIGFGDITSVGVAGGAGYLARSLDPIAPYFKFGIPGMFARDTAPLFTANGVNRLRLFMSTLRYTDYWIAYGVNDLGSGGRTPAQLLADNQTIAGYANPGSKVSISTLTAQSTSTDSWATTGNQTPPAQAANKATYDDLLRAVPAWVTGKVNDAGDASMTGRNTEIWSVTGGAWTTDGTHPNSRGASSIASQLSPLVP